MKCAHCRTDIGRHQSSFNDGARQYHSRCWKKVHTLRPQFDVVRKYQRLGCPYCFRPVGTYDWLFSRKEGKYYHLKCGEPFPQPVRIGGPK